MVKKYYLTTTLPYVNADPHIGFALEIVQADTLARFKRLQGFDVFFNTGTDEHGQKIYQKAVDANQDCKEYCDFWAGKFNKLKENLNLSYDYFSRTTNENHIKAAQEFWNRCKENGDIYKAKQTIKYCIGCELEKTESELVNSRCPLHPDQELEIREEENYFFRFSKYQDKLLNFYNENPDFVVPNFRLEEIKNFVENGLQDFSVSRLKSKMPWGITVPDDPEHVMYVWFDALINYISCLGWPEETEKLTEFWGSKENRNAVQVAGKDNLRQQSAIWQAMLMSANLPNSKQVFIHGFVTSDGVKMSKSLGNVVNPFAVVEKYGTDALRYYLLKEIHPFNDGDFTPERFIEIYNSDLANGLGNLVQRVSKMCEKNGVKIDYKPDVKDILKNMTYLNRYLNEYRFDLAIEEIWSNLKMDLDINLASINALNRVLDEKKPWELNREKATIILSLIVRSILNFNSILQIFLPGVSQRISEIFNGEVKAPEKALFPRIN